MTPPPPKFSARVHVPHTGVWALQDSGQHSGKAPLATLPPPPRQTLEVPLCPDFEPVHLPSASEKDQPGCVCSCVKRTGVCSTVGAACRELWGAGEELTHPHFIIPRIPPNCRISIQIPGAPGNMPCDNRAVEGQCTCWLRSRSPLCADLTPM